jgi:hypothetical protein
MWLEKATKARQAKFILEIKQVLLYVAKSSSVL